MKNSITLGSISESNVQDEIIIIKEIQTTKSIIEIFSAFSNLPYSILLDSSLKMKHIGEHSLIVFEPFLLFMSKGHSIRMIKGNQIDEFAGDPLLYLKRLMKNHESKHISDLPFVSGGVGYLSYDLCRVMEDLGGHAKDDLDMPDIVFGFYNTVITADHKSGKIYVSVSSNGCESCEDIQLYLEQKINGIMDRIAESAECCIEQQYNSIKSNKGIRTNFTLSQYSGMIGKAKEYIRNGDIYQVNLSQRFQACAEDSDPFAAYIDMRELNPAPFSAFLNFGDMILLSSSPERFIKIDNGFIETRPIKGTRPRGRTAVEDAALCAELINSEKDRAEHIMIVDLERNDMGRVCKIGSVHVKKLLDIEYYSTVFHLVSTVAGELQDNTDMIDCIKAMFPGGSITGAPKIRAMQIIEELEPVRRNIYTGSIGYIGFNGNCDLNIAIRTVMIKDNHAYLNVGGGIVWDSIPEDEYKETIFKGKALLKILKERL